MRNLLDEKLLETYENYVSSLFEFTQAEEMYDVDGLWECYRKHAGYYFALSKGLYSGNVLDVYQLATSKIEKAKNDTEKFRTIFGERKVF